MKRSVTKNEGESLNYMVLLRNLVLAYLVTAVALLILAFLLYKLKLPEKTVSISIIMIYAGSTFLAGFLAGKKLKKMKFVWGMLIGAAYFLVLVILSLAGGRAGTMFGKDFITTMLLCVGGGMLGGMLS